jgi:hypothetical protein
MICVVWSTTEYKRKTVLTVFGNDKHNWCFPLNDCSTIFQFRTSNALGNWSNHFWSLIKEVFEMRTLVWVMREYSGHWIGQELKVTLPNKISKLCITWFLYCLHNHKTRIYIFLNMEKNDFVCYGLYLNHFSNLTAEIL